jgi:predicted transposase YbfD/YdcC
MASSPISLQMYLRELKDSRRCPQHLLLDIMVIAVCAVICGANDWQQVVTFGRERQTWLATFLALPNGIPSHDTFERVFARINPRALTKVLQRWTQAVAKGLSIKHIAIDGKTLRGSAAKSKGLGALHIVSAWASAQHLSLGQVAVDKKSNEITAIPELLEFLDIRGALVTIDAMGCQKAIAHKVREREGHYALTVKDNQEHLLLDIQNALIEADEKDFVDLDYDTYLSFRKNSTQHYPATPVIRGRKSWLPERQWPFNCNLPPLTK